MESLIWALVKSYWHGPVNPDYIKQVPANSFAVNFGVVFNTTSIFFQHNDIFLYFQLKLLIVALSLMRHDQTCKLWMSGPLYPFQQLFLSSSPEMKLECCFCPNTPSMFVTSQLKHGFRLIFYRMTLKITIVREFLCSVCIVLKNTAE